MLIVDGHNVLFAMAGGGARPSADALEAAQAQLEKNLLRHYRLSGERATVVFDSRQLRGGARFEKRVPGLRVLYAHPPDTADDEIRRLVAASTAPQRLRIVTSDREVMRACTARGATVAPSPVFLREMRLAAERAARDEEEQRLKTARPTRDEVAELLEAFSDDADDGLQDRPRRPPGRHGRPS